jgi:hypothetical protein
MIYTVTYTRHNGKQKTIETRSIDARNMQHAVILCMSSGDLKDVIVSSISCTIKGSQGVQRFCDVCLKTEAVYGYKDKSMKCKECRNA